MAKYEKDARKFSSLFKKALTDKEGDKKKTTKEQERDYYNLTFFINGLKKKEQIDACLDEYLKIYTKYPTEDRRSKFVFAMLLKKRIEMSKENDKYIDDISDILADNQRPFRSPIRRRYEDLEQKEKAEIEGELKYKKERKKARTSILDLLKKSYSKTKDKEPTPQELLDYDPAPDKDLEEKFKALRDKCSISWSKNDAEDIKDGLKEFTDFLSKQKDSSKLFQILKWTRDVVIEKRQTVTYRNPPASDLERELYFQCVYWLFRYAVKHGYSKNYYGFTKEEKGFFFDPLSSAYFHQQYVNRYNAGITKASEFLQTSVLFLRLLIFARINDAELQNNEDASRIKKIHETTPKDVLRKKSFYMGVGAEVLRGNMRIGDKIGRVKIAYFDNVDTTNTSVKQIYVEFVGLENLLFKISIGTLSRFNENSFYTTLWENTRHLLKLIPWMFQLLGYTFSFVTGGFSALLTDVVIDIAVGEYAEAADLSPGATMALSGATSMGFPMIKGAAFGSSLGRNLANMVGDEARALKGVDDLMTDEARAVSKTQTATAGTHVNARMNGPDNTIQNIGTGGSGTGRINQGTGGSGTGRVNQGTGGVPAVAGLDYYPPGAVRSVVPYEATASRGMRDALQIGGFEPRSRLVANISDGSAPPAVGGRRRNNPPPPPSWKDIKMEIPDSSTFQEQFGIVERDLMRLEKVSGSRLNMVGSYYNTGDKAISRTQLEQLQVVMEQANHHYDELSEAAKMSLEYIVGHVLIVK